jgi:N-acetylneuraminate lyase
MMARVSGMFLLAASAAAFAPVALDREQHRITGLMIAVYTPMKSGGLELDLDVIPQYAQHLKSHNISNIMPAGSNGESLSLTVPERKSLAEAWASAAKANGLNLYMHVGSESLVESIELAKHAAATPGVSGILAMTPVYFKPTVDTLVDFLAQVAGAAPALPFWFYHFPDDTGVLPGKAHEFLERADETGKIPTLMGIKYTDYNLMDFQLCTKVGGKVGDKPKYNMLYGRDEQAVPALVLGAEAAVSSTIGYAPSLRSAVSLFLAGRQAEAVAQQNVNAKLCSFFGAYESQAINVQKNIMAMVGMPVGPSRLPKRDLAPAEATKLEAQLRSLGLLDAA